jgi:hypothetical protein
MIRNRKIQPKTDSRAIYWVKNPHGPMATCDLLRILIFATEQKIAEGDKCCPRA